MTDIKEAILKIYNKTHSKVFATLDKEGSYCMDENGNLSFSKAFKVEQVDSTGAGDSHMAGCLVGLVKDADPNLTCDFANAIAAQIVQKIGARFEASDRQKVDLHVKLL